MEESAARSRYLQRRRSACGQSRSMLNRFNGCFRGTRHTHEYDVKVRRVNRGRWVRIAPDRPAISAGWDGRLKWNKRIEDLPSTYVT